MTHTLRLPLFLAAAAFGFGLMAAPAAHAFTIENQDASGATQGFLDLGKPSVKDPDEQITSRFGTNQGTVNMGAGSLQFGVQPSFNQKFNSNSTFDNYSAGHDR